MEDILSGGTIDPSTDGPLPQNTDNRGQDIISEQRNRQDQDSIGGTQFAPRTQSLPPIPQAEEIAPQLPNIPSFNFDFGSDARELARQATIDVLKNVKINGQGPTVDGSSISFDIETTPSASEAFSFQLTEASIPQSLADFLQPPAQQQAAQAVENVRSFNLEPPSQPQPPIIPAQPITPEPQSTINQEQFTQDETKRDTLQRQQPESLQQKAEIPPEGATKPERIEDKESLKSFIEDIADRSGLQTTQRSWSNYVDPEQIKQAAEKRQEIKEAMKESGASDAQIQSAMDYMDGNNPFAQYIYFDTCYNGSAAKFLIPAFGPL